MSAGAMDLQQIAAQLPGCVLCHAQPVKTVGVFVPKEQHRFLFYGVCAPCWTMGSDAVSTLVEGRLFAEMSR